MQQTPTEQILDLITTLTLLEARQGDQALHAYMARVERGQQEAPNVVEQFDALGGCYRLERVKCGKPSCKCEREELHGPYWYRYAYKPGGQRKTYIGKHRPA